MSPEQRKLLEEWRDDCKLLLAVHYDRSALCEKINLAIALPAIILSAAVGTSIFASLAKDPSEKLKVLVGSVSILVGVLSGLQAYLKLPERAEKHRLTAASFAAMKKEIEYNLASGPPNAEATLAWINDVRTKWDGLRREAIALSTSELMRYRKTLVPRTTV